jgi:HAD superfamily hydrolase (TIGR01490 family)
MNLALFDLDHTLLPIDSDYEWGQYLVRLGKVDGTQYQLKNEAFFEQYNQGTLDIHEYLNFALGPLTGNTRTVLDEWHTGFMRDVIAPHISAQARALVNQHLHAGDLCALVTATNAFVTRPIATAFGLEHLIASEPEEIEGRFSGRVAGVPSFKAGKVIRTEAWLAQQGLDWNSFEQSIFYSDSANDLPLLEKVSTPIAVNPGNALRQIALERGWPVLDLFA